MTGKKQFNPGEEVLLVCSNGEIKQFKIRIDQKVPYFMEQKYTEVYIDKLDGTSAGYADMKSLYNLSDEKIAVENSLEILYKIRDDVNALIDKRKFGWIN